MAGNPGWRPRHDDPLFILAMDHRESFGRTLFDVRDDAPDPAQAAAMRAAKAGGRDTDLIVLGRDAPAERLDHWLEVASQVDAFTGFAIGRSIWEDTVRAYEASDRGEAAADAARGEIARLYLGFIAHWTPRGRAAALDRGVAVRRGRGLTRRARDR